MTRKRGTNNEKEARAKERIRRKIQEEVESKVRERIKEIKRIEAAKELQVIRKNHQRTQPIGQSQSFLFYPNPRQSAQQFIKTNGSLYNRWLSSRYVSQTSFYVRKFHSNDRESEKSALMEALTSSIVSLRADTSIDIDVSTMYGACFLGDGFPNFMRDLLKGLFPTLCHRLFRNFRLNETKAFKSNLFARFNFVWGETRDPSPSLPRLTVTLRRAEQPLRPASISLIANEAWVEDRLLDIQARAGNGHLALAMSQHRRLGRDSPLAKLDREMLLAVVAFLS